MTTRTDAILADGRDVICYDRRAGRAQRVGGSPPDCRQLAARAPASKLRWNSLQFGEYAVIAGHRQSRAHHPAASDCPLEASRPGRLTEIPAADYEVVVFENRYPPFSTATDHRPPSPEHHSSRSLARTVRGGRVLERARGRGDEIGATLPHPHGQIYGYSFVPPRAWPAWAPAWPAITIASVAAGSARCSRPNSAPRNASFARTGAGGLRPVRRSVAARGAHRPAAPCSGPSSAD